MVYPRHAVLLGNSNMLWQLDIWNRLTLKDSLHVICSNSGDEKESQWIYADELSDYGFQSSNLVPLSKSLFPTSKCAPHERNIVLHIAILRFLWLVMDGLENKHLMEDNCEKMWRCFPALVPHCCESAEAKDMLSVLHCLIIDHTYSVHYG